MPIFYKPINVLSLIAYRKKLAQSEGQEWISTYKNRYGTKKSEIWCITKLNQECFVCLGKQVYKPIFLNCTLQYILCR